MREIKFRYRLKNKETNNIFVDIVTLEQLENGYFEHHGYYHEGEWRWLILSRDLYTGLKDKKRTKEFPEGQGIYEGDILQTEYNQKCSCPDCDQEHINNKRVGSVIFSEGYFYCERYDGDYNIFKDDEVIGNIYENKDLLK